MNEKKNHFFKFYRVCFVLLLFFLALLARPRACFLELRILAAIFITVSSHCVRIKREEKALLPLRRLLIRKTGSISVSANMKPSANSTTASVARPHSLRGGFGAQPLRDFGSLILSLVVGSSASASGVGGGAFYVPLFDIAVGLGIKGATATSQVAVAAGALAAVAARWGRRHPADPGRPVVDWQMASVLQPPLLLGVSAGLLASHALPSWAITFIVILFLLFIAFDICVRATRLHRRETAAREEAAEEAAAAEEADAAAAGAGAGAARTSSQAPRLARHLSSSFAAGSVASLGTGSFLEDRFSAGAAKMSQQQRNHQRPSSASTSPRKARSMFDSPTAASPPTAAATGSRRATSDVAGAVPPAAPAAGSSVAAAAAAAAVEEAVATDNALETGNASKKGRVPFKPASSLAAQLDGEGNIDEEAEEEEDRDDVSSLDLDVGSSVGGGGGGASGSGKHWQRSAWGAASPLPALSPRSSSAAALPLSPETEGVRTLPSSPFDNGAPSSLSPSPGKKTTATATAATQQPQPPPPPHGRFHLRALASNGAAAAQLLLLFAAMTALQVVRFLSPPCSHRWVGSLSAQAALAAAATAVSVAAALAAAARGDTLPASAADAAVAGVYGAERERTRGRLLAAAAVGLLAGVVAALMGIGGGMVVVPLLLAFGIHPQSAAATSTVLILFSSTAAAAGQGAAGFIEPSFATAFGVSSLAAGALGVWLSSRYVDKSGRSSILVWLLAGVVGAGALLTAALGGRAAVEELRSGAGGVKPFCAP